MIYHGAARGSVLFYCKLSILKLVFIKVSVRRHRIPIAPLGLKNKE